MQGPAVPVRTRHVLLDEPGRGRIQIVGLVQPDERTADLQILAQPQVQRAVQALVAADAALDPHIVFVGVGRSPVHPEGGDRRAHGPAVVLEPDLPLLAGIGIQQLAIVDVLRAHGASGFERFGIAGIHGGFGAGLEHDRERRGRLVGPYAERVAGIAGCRSEGVLGLRLLVAGEPHTRDGQPVRGQLDGIADEQCLLAVPVVGKPALVLHGDRRIGKVRPRVQVAISIVAIAGKLMGQAARFALLDQGRAQGQLVVHAEHIGIPIHQQLDGVVVVDLQALEGAILIAPGGIEQGQVSLRVRLLRLAVRDPEVGVP